jgi:hypothetical protein
VNALDALLQEPSQSLQARMCFRCDVKEATSKVGLCPDCLGELRR